MSFKSDVKSLVLASLQSGPKHGYLIAKAIKSTGSSQLKVGESAIYPALQELEDSGAITSVWQPQEGRPPRKVYSITPVGTTEFEKKKLAWAKFSDAVNAVLNSPPETGVDHG